MINVTELKELIEDADPDAIVRMRFDPDGNIDQDVEEVELGLIKGDESYIVLLP